MGRSGLPRLGRINFSNCLPINLPIELGQVSLPADFVDGTPQELNVLFEEGQLELSSTSSFVYIKSKGELSLVPDLSISSLGQVGSVLFFSQCDPAALGDKEISVPAASATSIRLTALMLKLEFGIEARLKVVQEPQLNEEFSGALVIGDRALEIDDQWSQTATRIDLGEWWTQRFKLPMVFGVFVVRNDFTRDFKDIYIQLSNGLKQAKTLGTTTMQEDVIKRASQMTGLSKERMARYFCKELDYNLEKEHLESLSIFAKLLMENNLL